LHSGSASSTGTSQAAAFDFHLEFAPDETMPDFRDRAGGTNGSTPSELAVPSIFSALQRTASDQKLEPVKGLGDFLIIDQVERPSAK
jgi:uncharacterized protein (TIGR03435 family)